MNRKLGKRHFVNSTIVLALAVLFSRPLLAIAEDVVILDFEPSQTQIRFSLASFPHSVEGTFKLKRGRVRLDMRTSTAEGALVVDATSGESGNDWRDRDMRRDILETGRYPEITFLPESFVFRKQDSGDSPAKIRGMLTLHGSDHPIAMALSVRQEDKTITIVGHLEIPYVAWGLKDPSVLFLRAEKVVDVDLIATVSVRDER